MIVCGQSGRIYFVSSANVGSKHDSPILMQSELPAKMESLREMGLCYPHQMIGADNAYQAHLWWLVTPFLMQETVESQLKCQFNKWFCGLRQTVERMIGALKGRFPILGRFSRGLQFDNILDGIKVVNICVALHNYVLSKTTPEERAREQRIFDMEENMEPLDVQYVPDRNATNVKLLEEFSEYFSL